MLALSEQRLADIDAVLGLETAPVAWGREYCEQEVSSLSAFTILGCVVASSEENEL